MGTRVLIVAGEASADIYGARLIEQLRGLIQADSKNTHFVFVGVGGSRMREQGAEIRIDAREFSVVGVSEWVGRAGTILGNFRRLCRMIDRENWDVAVLIDLPDVNLRLAKRLKRQGVPVCYYVSPQLWAWRSGRVKQIQKYVDRMLVLYPFEVDFYKQRGVTAVFVGHPLVEMIEPRGRSAGAPGPLRIGVLPGSRPSEIRLHAPLLTQVCQRMLSRYPLSEVVIPIPGTLDEPWVRGQFSGLEAKRVSFSRDSHRVMREIDVALVASGTATVEAMLTGVPFTIFYKVRRSSKWLFDRLVDVPFIGMPNLLAGREVVREFFQDHATVDALFEETIRLIEDAQYRDAQMRALADCRSALSVSESKYSAATQVLGLLGREGMGRTL